MTPEIPFNPPPHNLELANGDAHVFCALLDQPLSRLEQFAGILSADERARAGRFVFQRDRTRFLAGRGQLREILGWLLGTDPAKLVFAYGEQGKPQLAKPFGGRFLYFNLAHADRLATYIVSAHHEVGIDIERIRPVREAEEIVARFFSPRENEEWRSLPVGQQMQAFFNLWTRKEAQLKANGSGLAGRFVQAERQPNPGKLARLSNATNSADIFSNYSLHSLTPAYGYVGAAATKNAGAPYCWQWRLN